MSQDCCVFVLQTIGRLNDFEIQTRVPEAWEYCRSRTIDVASIQWNWLHETSEQNVFTNPMLKKELNCYAILNSIDVYHLLMPVAVRKAVAWVRNASHDVVALAGILETNCSSDNKPFSATHYAMGRLQFFAFNVYQRFSNRSLTVMTQFLVMMAPPQPWFGDVTPWPLHTNRNHMRELSKNSIASTYNELRRIFTEN